MLDTFVRHTDKLVDLYIDGEVISTTGEHPFWTPDKGWVEAQDLVVGSLVQTSDGRTIDVDRVEKREGDFTVYNFKVEGFHSYFVSDLGILVHNAVCPTDDMWDDLDAFDNNVPGSFRDPVPDAVNHIMNDHRERLGELGLGGREDLQNLIDNLYNNSPQVWSRPDGTKAYVDPTKNLVFINNSKTPTVFNPTKNVMDYLIGDGFTLD